MKKETVVGVSAIVLLLGFVLAAWWYQGQETERVETIAEESATTLAPAHAMTVGPQDAKVTIVEFFDPACETCALFHKPVKDILASHPGQVRLVLRYAPFHAGSEDVVKMLEAARKQDRYWEVLEVMFETQPRWASHHHPQPELLWELIPAAGVDIDIERLREDAGDFGIASQVQQDIDDAATLGIRKTPGFLVNGRPLTSFGLQQLKNLVADEVAANY